MGRYVIRQLLQRIPLILGITLVVFALVHLTPGSPVDEYRLNPDVKATDIASLEKTLGLNKPLPEQYLTWISQVARGDLGISLKNYRPVRSLIFQRLGNTLLLTGTALFLAILIAVPVGVLSAIKRNSFFDYVAVVCTTLADSIPGFWFGLLLILVFAVQFKQWGLPWLPSGGVQSLPNGGDFFDRAKHIIMPAAALGLQETARWVRYTRGQMLEVLNEDYVRTARAKGIAEHLVIMGHAFRNA
ncbi:MAG: ABC transporter permease, partial [Thermomicrobia bacterium]|nr:ABC transporter permease [Thermomicrobia bacterium]